MLRVQLYIDAGIFILIVAGTVRDCFIICSVGNAWFVLWSLFYLVTYISNRQEIIGVMYHMVRHSP
jgi:hypothetical protein